MKTLRNFLIIGIGLFMIISCNNKKEETKDKVLVKNDNVELSEGVNKSTIIGKWVAEKKGRWLEFMEDGTFNMGMEGKDDVKGKKYELDLAKSTITIQTKKATKIFQFRRTANDLFIKIEGTDKELKYSLKTE